MVEAFSHEVEQFASLKLAVEEFECLVTVEIALGVVSGVTVGDVAE